MKQSTGLAWRWIAVGVFLMVGLHIIAYLALGSWVISLVDRAPMTAFLVAGFASLFIYFIGGVVVGRYSWGRTIQEPAVAAVIGLFFVFILQISVGMINIFGLLIGAPLCFIMAYLGGYLGELWQQKVLDRESK